MLYYKQVDELLTERDNIHSAFTTVRTLVNSAGSSSGGGPSNRYNGDESQQRGNRSPIDDGGLDGRDRSNGKKKWFGINLNRSR